MLIKKITEEDLEKDLLLITLKDEEVDEFFTVRELSFVLRRLQESTGFFFMPISIVSHPHGGVIVTLRHIHTNQKLTEDPNAWKLTIEAL